MKQKEGLVVLGIIVGIIFFASPPNLYADDVQNINYVERGFLRILTAAFQLPIYLVQKTLAGPPIVGTVDGALTGAFYTISSVTGGAFDIARGAVPYAKYLIFFA